MAYTQADIDALRAKMITFAGVRGATMGDGQATQFSYDDAEKLLAKMEREVNGATSRTRYAATSKDV